MKKYRKQTFLILMFIFMVFSTFFSIYINKTYAHVKTQTREAVPLANYQAPAFSLQDLNKGEVYQLGESMNKPVIVNFWASWCPPCQNEAPEFVKLYNKYHKTLNIYAVNMTNSDQLNHVQAFVKKFGYQFPVLLDSDGNVSKTYWVNTLPTTLFISRKGKILARHTGYISQEELNHDIKKLGIGD